MVVGDRALRKYSRLSPLLHRKVTVPVVVVLVAKAEVVVLVEAVLLFVIDGCPLWGVILRPGGPEIPTAWYQTMPFLVTEEWVVYPCPDQNFGWLLPPIPCWFWLWWLRCQ